jgi:hypothetical protein
MPYLYRPMHLRLLFILLVSLLSTRALAVQVRGTVSDQDGEPIAYANVFLQNTTYGVLTNIKGEYFIELDPGTHQLSFSSLGFSKVTKEVIVEKTAIVLDITLLPDGVSIDTVTVTAGRKDPAYAIMQQVIDNKKRYQHQFNSYTRETYLKASLEVELIKKEKADSLAADSLAIDSLVDDSLPRKIADLPPSTASGQAPEDTVLRKGYKDGPGIGPFIWRKGYKDGLGSDPDKPKEDPLKKDERRKLNLIESISTTYFADPNSYKSIIHAYRDLSEKGEGGSTISVGEDGVDVANYQTITNNPYLFYLDPTDAEFNFYDNLIRVLRLGDQPFISPLSSTAWRLTYRYRLVESFLESGRVIHRIAITPINREGAVFEGEICVVDGLWAIKSVNLQILRGNLSFFRDFRMLHAYDMTDDQRWTLSREEYYYTVKDPRERYYGNTIAIHTDYQLDVQHPKNFFRNELRRVEKEAFEMDSTYWDSLRPITLKKAELEFIHIQDSIRAYHESADYLREQDSIYNHLSVWDILLQGMGWRDRKRRMEYFINPLISQPNFFGVGGYRHMLGGNITKTFAHYHRLELNTEIDYGVVNGDVKYFAKLSFVYNPKHFSGFYIKGGDRYSMVTSVTSVVGIFSRNNWVRKLYGGVGHTTELLNGLYWDIDLDFADRQAISGLNLDNDIFGGINDPLNFATYREFLIATRLRWTPFQKYHSEPYRKVVVSSTWPTFELSYRKGLPGVFGSEINFDKVELRVTDEFRPGSFGISRWALVVGSYIQEENLRVNDYKYFRGSTPFLFTNPMEDFQNLDTTYGTTGTFYQANFLHNEAGSLINKIPLLRRTPLELNAGASFLAIPDKDLLHVEVFGGITMPFRIKQQRFKAGVMYVTSYSTSFGNAISGQIKFGITFYDTWKNRWNW